MAQAQLRQPRFARGPLMPRVLVAVWVLAGAALAVRVGLADFWSLLRAPGPPLSGSLRLAGIGGEVRVLRDRYAHVHIHAGSEADAFFGLGFAHAQDRLWQMELLRRTARGRSAELFGAGAVLQDRVARTLGLGEAAEREAGALAEPTAGLLAAYAAGVNAWLDELRLERAPLPGELRWLRVPLENWTPADTLAVLRLRAWAQSRSLGASLLLDRLVRERGSSASQLLFPAPGRLQAGPLEGGRLQAGPLEGGRLQAGPFGSLLALGRAADRLAGAAGLGGGPVGSSGLLVGVSRSSRGWPLLANDPHVELSVPARFYIAHLETPQRAVAGATWPGAPVFWLGSNHRIAWGQVALQVVVSDLFDETLDPRRPGRYQAEGQWREAQRETESIAVRGGAAVPIEVIRTRHGPLLGSILPDDAAVRSYALRWTGADRHSGIEPLLALQRAGGWEEFRAALRSYPAPPATFLYADVAGTIGTQVAGSLPVRPIDTQLLPVPAEYGWTGYLPFEELPSRYGADIDWVAVSREGDGRPFAGAAEWLWPDGEAVQRVRERLRAGGALDLGAVLDIQREQVSASGPRQVRALLAGAQPRTRGGRQVRELLLAWDGSTDAASAGTAVYHVFRQELARKLLAARFAGLGELGEQIAQAEPMPGVLLARFVERATGEAGAGAELASAALDDAWAWFATHQSSNPRRWLWGELRRVRFAHDFELQGGPALRWVGGWLGLGSPAVPGDPDSAWTIYHRSLLQPAPAVGPALRYAIDLGDPYHARIALAGGQSGYAGSPYYRDGLAPWLSGEPRFLWTHPSDVADRAVGVWELAPLLLAQPPQSAALAADPPGAPLAAEPGAGAALAPEPPDSRDSAEPSAARGAAEPPVSSGTPAPPASRGSAAPPAATGAAKPASAAGTPGP